MRVVLDLECAPGAHFWVTDGGLVTANPMDVTEGTPKTASIINN